MTNFHSALTFIYFCVINGTIKRPVFCRLYFSEIKLFSKIQLRGAFFCPFDLALLFTYLFILLWKNLVGAPALFVIC